MPRQSYPFPTQKPGVCLPCFIRYPKLPSREVYSRLADHWNGDEYRWARLRYLTIEEELERAYQYVAPCGKNTEVFSFKFAEVIRSAASAYEVQCKRLYSRFYNNSDHIDIFSYLALDRFVSLARGKVGHLLALDSFVGHPEVHQPFVKLASWDRNSHVLRTHVPTWWDAYNAVKHDDGGIVNAATLAHATAALAALFLLTETVYGGGILVGGPVRYENLSCGIAADGQEVFSLVESGELNVVLPRWSRLFNHHQERPALTLIEEAPVR